MTGEPLMLFALDGEDSVPTTTSRVTERSASVKLAAPYPDASASSGSAVATTTTELRLLLTPVEAARALGISRSKLYELIGDGSVGSVLIGASRRVPADALAAYVASLRGSSAAPPSTDRRNPPS